MINRRNALVPIHRAMDDFLSEFERMENDLFSSPFFRDNLFLNKAVARMPKLNVRDKGDKFVIEAAVPGLNRDEVNLSVENDKVLVIKHKRHDIVEQDEEQFLLREVSFRAFERKIPFAEKIDKNKVKAKLENGILKVEVPKVKEKQVEENSAQIKIE